MSELQQCPPGSPPVTSRASYDQLDTLVRVTTIQAWVYLATLFAVCVAAVVFAVLYEVPTKVAGEGILLIDDDTLSLVRARATGRLVELKVKLGEELVPGEVVGRISQDDLTDSIHEMESKLNDLQREDDELTKFEKKEKATHEAAIARVTQATSEARQNSLDKRNIADRIVTSSDRLRSQHYLGDLELLSAREKLYEISRDLNNGKTRLAELELEAVKAENARLRAQIDRRSKIKQQRTKLDLERKKLERTSQVVSGARGRVAEIRIAPGDLVHEGAPILLLHSPRVQKETDDAGPDYEAIVFVPAGEGKKIEVDHRVEVSPATVKREEHGFLRGRVVSISELPSTKLAMEAALGHPELVDTFLKRYAPGVLLGLHVKLDEEQDAQHAPLSQPQAGRKKHFKWSSSSLPHPTLKTGTMCQAAIVVRKQRLISLLLPWIKTQTGVS